MSSRITGDAAFTTVPKWIHGAGLSDSQFRLYVIMCGYADNETGEAYPSRATLAELMGKGVKTVDRALAELVEMGLITKVPQYRDKGNQTSNLYTVNRIRRVTGDHGGASRVSPLGASPESPLGASPMTPELEQRELDQKELDTAAANPKPKGRKHPLPDGWRPSDSTIAWINANTPGLDINLEVEKMRNWTRASGRTYIDWDATFRNHCITAHERKAERNAPRLKTDHKGRTIDEHGRIVTPQGTFR